MRDVFGELKTDLDQRNREGYRLHGRPLDVADGRDWLQEAYEEALDLAVYLKAALVERNLVRSNGDGQTCEFPAGRQGV